MERPVRVKVFLVNRVREPLPLNSVASLEGIWHEETPDCIIFTGGSAAEELAARLSARLDIPCCTGVTGARCTKSDITLTRRVYGSELVAEYTLAFPCLAVLDSDVKPTDIGIPDVTDDQRVVEPDLSPESWYEGFEPLPDDKATGLQRAQRVVAVGRGVRKKAQYETVEELAKKLDAAVGVTRPVVHNGWAPPGTQIGVSGTSVKPDICLIVGASGSQAFLGAIDKGVKIIAVNNDRGAPVFRRASWGVVCDADEILNELIIRMNK